MILLNHYYIFNVSRLNGFKIEISNHMDLHILKFYTSVYENNIQKPKKSIKKTKIKLI